MGTASGKLTLPGFFLKPGKIVIYLFLGLNTQKIKTLVGNGDKWFYCYFLLGCHLIIFLIFIRCRALLDLLYILNQATLIQCTRSSVFFREHHSLSLNTRPLVGFLVFTNFLKLKQFWWYLHVLYKLNDTFRLSLNTIEFHVFFCFFFFLKCDIWLFFTPSFSVK